MLGDGQSPQSPQGGFGTRQQPWQAAQTKRAVPLGEKIEVNLLANILHIPVLCPRCLSSRRLRFRQASRAPRSFCLSFSLRLGSATRDPGPTSLTGEPGRGRAGTNHPASRRRAGLWCAGRGATDRGRASSEQRRVQLELSGQRPQEPPTPSPSHQASCCRPQTVPLGLRDNDFDVEVTADPAPGDSDLGSASFSLIPNSRASPTPRTDQGRHRTGSPGVVLQ